MKTVVNKTTGQFLYNTMVDVFLNDNEMIVDFVPEVLTEEQIILQSRQNQALQIKEKYEQHRLNGWNAYQDFRAMIVLDIYEGKITETQAFLIENDLKVAYDRIAQNGDWKTAYYELSQKTVSYPFIQAYMYIALNFIQNYIQTNYDS